MPRLAEGDAAAGAQGIRLQKVLAAAGFGSRRACEELISAGRVQVNGRPARLGARVDPAARHRRSSTAARCRPQSGLAYLAINKPRGMLSTMSDERGRPCVGDLVARHRRHSCTTSGGSMPTARGCSC